MTARIEKFARDFVAALLRCALEDWELISAAFLLAGLILPILFLGLLLCGATRVVYELMADPYSTRVSDRLLSVSIDPYNFV